MKLIPHCLTPKEHLRAFVVWLGLVSSHPLAHPVPYLPQTTLRLYLNTFRGEPAISGFVWRFTPTHSSSQHFAPYTGSVLHPEIIGTSTWPWVAHPVSGLIQTTHRACWRVGCRTRHLTALRPDESGLQADRRLLRPRRLRSVHALLGLAFAGAPELISLNLAAQINSPAHSSIGTRVICLWQTSTACRSAVSGLFHSPSGVLFTFPSRYWFTIGGQEYLALEGGPPSFPQDFTCPVVLNNTSGAPPKSPTGLSPSSVVLSQVHSA